MARRQDTREILREARSVTHGFAEGTCRVPGRFSLRGRRKFPSNGGRGDTAAFSCASPADTDDGPCFRCFIEFKHQESRQRQIRNESTRILDSWRDWLALRFERLNIHSWRILRRETINVFAATADRVRRVWIRLIQSESWSERNIQFSG